MMELNNYQINFLLEHLGYGAGTNSPEKVEILFIGNESGTAGRSIEEYINRLTYPEKYNHEKQVEANNDNSPQRKSPMLQFMNRLRLYSLNPDSKWLLPKADMIPDDYNRVINESWCLGDSVHLLDIRPLPRPTEGNDWPYIGIDRKLYLKAFNNFSIDSRNPYGDWVAIRQANLQNKIKSFNNLKCIVAAGNPNMKLNFIKGLFPEINFEYKIGASGNTFQLGTYENRFKIVVCKFLNHQNGIGYNGLKDLAQLVF